MPSIAIPFVILAYAAYFMALLMPFGQAVVFSVTAFVLFCGFTIGFEQPFVLFFAIFTAVGFVSGFIIKAITTFIQKRKKAFVVAVVHIIGLVLAPVIILGPRIFAEVRDGTLLRDSNYDNITFIIDDKKIATPGFSIVNAYCAFGDNGQQLIHLYLDDKNTKRQFCGRFNSGDKPITVQSVEFRFAQLDEAIRHKRFLNLCNTAGWPKEVCEFKTGTWRKTPEYYPFKLTIIDKNELQRLLSRMIWEPENYAFATTTEKLENLKIDEFHYNGDAFAWVNKAYEQQEISFYLLNCSKAAKLRCTALEKTKNKTFIYYSFEAYADSLNEDAKNIHDKLDRFVEILSKVN